MKNYRRLPDMFKESSATRLQSRPSVAMHRQEKRKEQRFQMVLPVRYGWDEQGARQHGNGHTRDLSSRGTYILSNVVPNLGTAIELEVALNGFAPDKHGTTLHGKAIVVRNELAGFATSGRVKMASINDLRTVRRTPKSSNHD